MDNWVIEALKLGSLGLAFLFGVLAYRLVRIDHAGQNPATKPFMLLCFVSLVVAAGVEIFRISSDSNRQLLSADLGAASSEVERLNAELGARDVVIKELKNERGGLAKKADRFDLLVNAWNGTLRIQCGAARAAASEAGVWSDLRPIESAMCVWYRKEYRP